MNARIKELEEEISEAFQRMNRPEHTIEDFETNNAHQEKVIALCERELKELRQAKATLEEERSIALQRMNEETKKRLLEKPCDGFEIVKSSKVKAVLIAPIAALTGWVILLWLISRR